MCHCSKNLQSKEKQQPLARRLEIDHKKIGNKLCLEAELSQRNKVDNLRNATALPLLALIKK